MQVRKLSIVCLHKKAFVAKGILVTRLHCGTPELRLSAIYIVSSVGTSSLWIFINISLTEYDTWCSLLLRWWFDDFQRAQFWSFVAGHLSADDEDLRTANHAMPYKLQHGVPGRADTSQQLLSNCVTASSKSAKSTVKLSPVLHRRDLFFLCIAVLNSNK